MKTIKQFPNIAVAFGLVAIATAIILIFTAPNWLKYVLAVFWLVTGLLGIYLGFRRSA